MAILTLASFNVQNPNMKKNVDIDLEMEEVAKIIKDNEIDILCCQEMLVEYIKKLENKLEDYYIAGRSRYGENVFSRYIPILRKYNECTLVVSRKKIVSSVHHYLPWLPKRIDDIKNGIFKYKSLTPRILTGAMVELDDGFKFKVFNTHLEKKIINVQRRQLEYILNLCKSTCPLILTGDFNMDINSDVFQSFVERLERIGLRRVPIDTKTLQFSKKKRVVDHIFVPRDWKVLECNTVSNSISDHYLLLVKIDIPV